MIEMVLIERENYKFQIDNYLKNNLDIILKEAIPFNWDALLIIIGKEGSGKSTLATQLALYLDKKFTIDYVEFNPDKLDQLIEDCPPESSIVWDEAITGARSAQHASRVSQIMISKFTQIRKKKLKIIICFPYLYMLNKYFISRCVACIYVYAKGFMDRGHFIAYNQEQTMFLHSLIKNKYSDTPDMAFKKAKKSFYGNYPNVFCLPTDEYDLKKDNARQEDEPEDNNIWKSRIVKLIKHYKLKRVDVAKLWGVSPQYLTNLNKYT